MAGGRCRVLGGLAALLGVSILTSSFPSTQAQSKETEIPVTLEPKEPFLGGNVTLTPGGNPKFMFCHWSRERSLIDKASIFTYFAPPSSVQHNGPGYTGRETASPKCALHIRNLTQQDSAVYIVVKDGQDFDYETGTARIKVTAGARRGPDKRVSAGIAVGALAGAVLLGVLLFYSYRQCSQRMAQRVSKSSLPPPAPAKEPTV